MLKRLFTIAGVVVCCASVVGLGHLVARPSGAPRRAEAEFPIDALLVRDLRDGQTVFYATHLAIAECMEARGFEYPVGTYTAPPPTHVSTRPFGVFLRQDAEVFGYREPGYLRPPMGDGPSAYAAQLGSDSRAQWSEALWGSGNGGGESHDVVLPGGERVSVQSAGTSEGCFSQVKSRLQGDQYEYLALVQRINEIENAALNNLKANDRLLGALERWQTCMSKLGEPYSSPLEIPAAHPEWKKDVTPSDAEREIAIKDVGCKVRSRLMETWWNEGAETQNRLLSQDSDIVARWTEIRAHELEVARGLPHEAPPRRALRLDNKAGRAAEERAKGR